jgi:hypothetical protein
MRNFFLRMVGTITLQNIKFLSELLRTVYLHSCSGDFGKSAIGSNHCPCGEFGRK